MGRMSRLGQSTWRHLGGRVAWTADHIQRLRNHGACSHVSTQSSRSYPVYMAYKTISRDSAGRYGMSDMLL